MNIVTVNFSEGFPMEFMDDIMKLEVYSKLLANGNHYRNAVVDSACRGSALSDLLFDKRGMNNDLATPQLRRCQSLFHTMSRNGFACSFLGSYGLSDSRSVPHEATMRQLGVQNHTQSDAHGSKEPCACCDANAIRQAQAIVVQQSKKSYTFVSLRGPCDGKCGNGIHLNCDDYEKYVSDYLSMIDGLLCGLLETLNVHTNVPCHFILSATHLVSERVVDFNSIESLTSFLITGTPCGRGRGVVDDYHSLREVYRNHILSLASGSNLVDSQDGGATSYNLSFSNFKEANARVSLFGHKAFGLVSVMRVGDAWYSCSMVFSLEDMLESTGVITSSSWSAMSRSQKVKLVCASTKWKLKDVCMSQPVSVRWLPEGNNDDIPPHVSQACRARMVLIVGSELDDIPFGVTQTNMLRLSYPQTMLACLENVGNGDDGFPSTFIVDDDGTVRFTFRGCFAVDDLALMAKENTTVFMRPHGRCTITETNACIYVNGDEVDMGSAVFHNKSLYISVATKAARVTNLASVPHETLRFEQPKRTAFIPGVHLHDNSPVDDAVSTASSTRRSVEDDVRKDDVSSVRGGARRLEQAKRAQRDRR